MNVLSLETSTEVCSVALLCGARLHVRESAAGQQHSEIILPMIEALLNEAGIGVADLDGVAFGAGPGSFTGLRIACGVAQGLAFGRDIPVAPVGTLQALAAASGATRVIACLDARMGEVYHAVFERRADIWQEWIAPNLCAPGSAPEVEGDGWTGCGSGFDAHRAALEARYGNRLAGIREGLFPHAREVAELGGKALAAGLGVAAEQALPLYIRDKVALKMDERK
jgi:tRNA threonylcarbamoyladenosine biosynthesis protein TsaB